MKKIVFTTSLLVTFLTNGQIKGNRDIVSKSIELENLTHLDINLYGEIIIDPSIKEEIRITGDSNVLEYIDTDVVDGRLDLTQLKWIQPSESLKIEIGAPNIESVSHGTNGTIQIKNLNQEKLAITVLNGGVLLNGTVSILNANAENGTLDAKNLMVNSTNLNIWGYGKAILNTKSLKAQNLSNEAILELVKDPISIKGNVKNALKNSKKSFKDVAYIRFKIKNNSSNRNNFYVVGPKPEGGRFSYGFPMMPGAIRKENWTTGTKVYKVNGIGIKKLLVTISATDEGQIVSLFQFENAPFLKSPEEIRGFFY